MKLNSKESTFQTKQNIQAKQNITFHLISIEPQCNVLPQQGEPPTPAEN